MLKMFLEVTALWGRPCLVTKPLWGPLWTGRLALYSDMGPTVI
jgi:hypothetical protein